MDWMDLAERLDEALLAATDDLLASHSPRALALVTEDGAMSVGLAADTDAALDARLAAERAADPGLSPPDDAWIRWSVSEWAHEGWRDDLFAPLNRILTDAALTDDFTDAHLSRLVEAITAALLKLRSARAERLAHTILFVTLTDSDDADALEDASARRLNPPALRDAFLTRYD